MSIEEKMSVHYSVIDFHEVVVVGAGLAGLRATQKLSEQISDILVIEKDRGVGGLAWSPTIELPNGTKERVHAGPSEHMSTHTSVRRILEETRGSPDLDRNQQNLAKERYANELPETVILAEKELEMRMLQSGSMFTRIGDLNTRGSDVSPEKYLPWWDEAKRFIVTDGVQYMQTSAKSLTTSSYGVMAKYIRKCCENRGVQFHTDARVAGIRSANHGFIVSYIHDKRLQEVQCSNIVLAVPPRGLLGINLEKCSLNVRGRVRDLVGSCSEVFSTRVHFVYENAQTWLQKNAGTSAAHLIDNQSLFRWAIALSPTILLASYTDDETAKRLAESLRNNKEETCNRLLQDINARLSPGMALSRPTAVHVGGAHGVAAFHVRTNPQLNVSSIAAPDNGERFVIAGEWVSDPRLRGWMEGALQSGERAAKALLSRR